MRYYIDRKVLFDPQHGTLSGGEEEMKVFQLSALQAKILGLLVSNVGKPVERNDILSVMNGLDGVCSSNNLLNHSIRHLRSVLYQLNPKEVIFTLHGTGYLFKGAVTDEESLRVACVIPDEAGAQIKRAFFFVPAARLVALTLLLIIFVSNVRDSPSFLSSPFYFNKAVSDFSSLPDCHVYAMQEMTGFNKQDVTTIIKEFMKERKITCNNQDALFFYVREISHMDSIQKNELTFLAKCKVSKDLWGKCWNWYVHPEGDDL